MLVPSDRSRRRLGIIDGVLLLAIGGAILLVIRRAQTTVEYDWNWSVIPQYLLQRNSDTGRLVPNLLLRGLFTTLRLSLWSSALALVIGTAIGMLRVRRGAFARIVSRGYVELVRNTPPLVIIFIFYFFLGNQITSVLGIEGMVDRAGPGTLQAIRILFDEPARFSEFLSAVLTLGIYEGAYITEIVRAGIQSVEEGQWEAAHALGLSNWDRQRFVVLPQALRTILPALAGQFISVIKDSAIVSVISIQELTFQGLELMSATYLTFEIWIAITVLYFVLTFICSLGARKLEAALSRHRR